MKQSDKRSEADIASSSANSFLSFKRRKLTEDEAGKLEEVEAEGIQSAAAPLKTKKPVEAASTTVSSKFKRLQNELASNLGREWEPHVNGQGHRLTKRSM
jgi:hypothetical protein